MKKKILSGLVRGRRPALAAAVVLLVGAACSMSEPASASLANPGFESGDTDWTLEGGAVITDFDPYSGTHHLQLPVTADDGAYAEQVFPIVMGDKDQLNYSYYVRRTGPGVGVVSLELEFYNDSAQLLSASAGSSSCSLDYGIQSGGIALPTGTVQGKIRVLNRTTGINPGESILYVDNMEISLGTAPVMGP